MLTAVLVALLTCLCTALTPTSIVLWHGMGDTCCDPQSMGAIIDLLVRELPGVFVHSVQVGSSVDDDKKRGFFDDINLQIDSVCTQLATIPQLQLGFNAIGFSQGGLFLRAYIERCDTPSPPVHHLITFGSPHQGVSDVPASMCSGEGTWCTIVRQVIQTSAYTSYAQHRILQATYYKDPRESQYTRYVKNSILLADINNDVVPTNTKDKSKQLIYKHRLSQLRKLVLVMFEKDTMIVPKETAWFGTRTENGKIINMRNTTLYKDDLIGLRTLDKEGKLDFLSYPTDHLQFDLKDFVRDIVDKYFRNSERSRQSINKSTPFIFQQQL